MHVMLKNQRIIKHLAIVDEETRISALLSSAASKGLSLPFNNYHFYPTQTTDSPNTFCVPNLYGINMEKIKIAYELRLLEAFIHNGFVKKQVLVERPASFSVKIKPVTVNTTPRLNKISKKPDIETVEVSLHEHYKLPATLSKDLVIDTKTQELCTRLQGWGYNFQTADLFNNATTQSLYAAFAQELLVTSTLKSVCLSLTSPGGGAGGEGGGGEPGL